MLLFGVILRCHKGQETSVSRTDAYEKRFKHLSSATHLDPLPRLDKTLLGLWGERGGAQPSKRALL